MGRPSGENPPGTEIAGWPDVHPYEFDVSDFRTPDKSKIRDALVRMTDKRFAETVARDAGAVLGPVIYSDALSAPDGLAATYLAMLRHNTTQFVAAMQ